MTHLANSILSNLIRRDFITFEESLTDVARDAAISTAEWHEDDEEIGSSDMTFIMGEALSEMGKKVDYSTGYLKLV